jgi:ankyrin repeat protein
MTPLHYAVKNGHLDTLKVLLSHSAEVESIIEDRDGKTTALMTACHQAHLAIIEVLLEYKAQVNFHGGAAGNALEVASESGDVAIVKLLLKHEADVDLHGGGSGKALGVASRNGHITVVEMLLQHRADVNLTEKNCETAAAAACSTGHLDIVKLLVKHSARIFEKTMDSACKRECGTDAVLEFLLYSGAAPTPKVLEEASKCGWLKRCQILLNHGVSITPAAVSNACDYFCKDDGVLDLLLERGGIATSEALERAVGNGWLKRYQKLLDHGVSITPAAISNACCYFCKDSEVLDLLLEKGGTATSKALERAVENGWLKRCQKLLDHGAPITPAVVSNACGARCTDDGLLDLLLERGGVATSKALEMACHYGRYTSCKKLLDAGALITSKALAYAWRDGKSGRTAQLLHTRGEKAGLTAKMLVSAEWKYNCWLSVRDCGSFDDSEDEPEEDNKDETDIEIE